MAEIVDAGLLADAALSPLKRPNPSSAADAELAMCNLPSTEAPDPDKKAQTRKIQGEVPSPLRKRLLKPNEPTSPAKFPRLDISGVAQEACQHENVLLELTTRTIRPRVLSEEVAIATSVDETGSHGNTESEFVYTRHCFSNIPEPPPLSVSCLGQESEAVQPGDRETSPPETRAPRPFSSEETLIIFDWDDTILPSTSLFCFAHEPHFQIGDKVFWLHANDMVPQGAIGTIVGFANTGVNSVRVEFPKGTWLFDPLDLLDTQDLCKAADSMIETLRIAQQHGTVVFVTNSQEGFIEKTCQKFLPRLYEHLENVRLVSARSTYESPTLDSPLGWKLLAFQNVRERVFGNDVLDDPTRRKNIVSIGDGVDEREAVLSGTASLPNCRSKSVKFVERPDIKQICTQHTLIREFFDRIIHHDGGLDLFIKSSQK